MVLNKCKFAVAFFFSFASDLAIILCSDYCRPWLSLFSNRTVTRSCVDVTERGRQVTGGSSSCYVQVFISFSGERLRPEAARAVSLFNSRISYCKHSLYKGHSIIMCFIISFCSNTFVKEYLTNLRIERISAWCQTQTKSLQCPSRNRRRGLLPGRVTKPMCARPVRAANNKAQYFTLHFL